MDRAEKILFHFNPFTLISSAYVHLHPMYGIHGDHFFKIQNLLNYTLYLIEILLLKK